MSTELADNNANIIESFKESNLSDSKSFPETFYRKYNTVLTFQIKGYFDWESLSLNITDVYTLGWLPTQVFPTGSWKADIVNLWVPMVPYSKRFSGEYFKKSIMLFSWDLVGNVSRSEQMSHCFFQADL